MAWNLTTATNSVHYGLGQDPGDSTNLVDDAMILVFLKEAVEVACMHGRIYTKAIDYTIVNAANFSTFALIDTGVDDIIDVISIVYQSTGVALDRIKPEQAGKVFQSGGGSDVMWYYVLGQSVFWIPPPATGPAMTVNCYCVDNVSIAADLATLQVLQQYHPQLIQYAIYRGKHTYGQHQESNISLQAFASGIGVDIQLLKEKLGVA